MNMKSEPLKTTELEDQNAVERAQIFIQQARYLFTAIADANHYVVETAPGNDGRIYIGNLASIGSDLMLEGERAVEALRRKESQREIAKIGGVKLGQAT